MKKIDVYLFSGTGNTLKCAQELRDRLQEMGADVRLNRIETGAEQADGEADTLVICYPVHGFNAPQNVVDFCKNLPTGTASAYVMKTSGEPLSVNDNSSALLVKHLKRKGYSYKGEYHFVMPYNMIFRHSDEMAAKMWQTAKARIPAAAQTMLSDEEHCKTIPVKAKVVRRIVAIEHWGARFNGRFFRVKKDKCVHCMKCVNNCPTKNITFADGKFHFGGNCLLCTRCSFHCPADAFRIGLMDFLRVNGKYNFDANPDEATIGKYCRKSYVRYFDE